METYPEMNEQIKDILTWDHDNPVNLYAAKRIEELEEQNAALEVAVRCGVRPPTVLEVLALKDQHKATWRRRPETFWLARLVAEVGELSLALLGTEPTKPHLHTPDSELKQIAAIAMNWLEMREEKGEL